MLQIADLGGRIPVKLFTFSIKIKDADKNIDSVSQDSAATGAVLQQLGKQLPKDEITQLCSSEAVATAKQLAAGCHVILNELDGAIYGRKPQGAGQKLIMGWNERLKFSFPELQIELLRSNLKRLKSSLVVMLSVLIYAEQLKKYVKSAARWLTFTLKLTLVSGKPCHSCGTQKN